MNTISNLSQIKKVQVFACTFLFLFLITSCEEKEQDNTNVGTYFYSIKPLTTFKNGDTFKINTTTIIHSEDFLFKKNSKDTLWIPSSKYIYAKAPGVRNLYETSPSTDIMFKLAKNLVDFKICSVTDSHTISTQGFITMTGNLKMYANKEYSEKVNFWEK